jgi:hypothetical protein
MYPQFSIQVRPVSKIHIIVSLETDNDFTIWYMIFNEIYSFYIQIVFSFTRYISSDKIKIINLFKYSVFVACHGFDWLHPRKYHLF